VKEDVAWVILWVVFILTLLFIVNTLLAKYGA
jgi:hypothetical protein